MSRVLLVDDDAAGLAIRQLMLERHGHEVTKATNVAGALAMFRAENPEVIVLDLRLPELEDGLSLIREFRASAPAVRIVILAGNRADLDGRPEAALVDQILGKPVRSEVLLAAIAGPSKSV